MDDLALQADQSVDGLAPELINLRRPAEKDPRTNQWDKLT
jgi:hypothetical protein